MRVPKTELPDMDQIAVWAQENLPNHYRLIGVRCVYGSDWPEVMPQDFEIAIEYEDALDAALAGSIDAIDAHHSWADPLIAKIRADWPAPTIRIGFHGKSTSHS